MDKVNIVTGLGGVIRGSLLFVENSKRQFSWIKAEEQDISTICALAFSSSIWWVGGRNRGGKEVLVFYLLMLILVIECTFGLYDIY